MGIASAPPGLEQERNGGPVTATSLTIPAKVFEAGRHFGDRVAIRAEDRTEIRYHEIEGLARAVASALIAVGINAGDRVAIWAPNRPEWIIAALGLQAAGAVLVPLNTRLKGREAGHILRASGARVLFTVGSFLGTEYPSLLEGEDTPALERIVRIDDPAEWQSFIARGDGQQAEVDRRLSRLGENDLSDILFTSGTTGLPKGAMTAHGQNLRMFLTYAQKIGLREGDIYLVVNPFFHSFGYKAGWLAALISGATALPHATFDAVDVLRRIQEERVTVLPGPPTIYHSLLAGPWRDYDLSSLRLAITGAASVPEALIHEMIASLGFDVVLTAYGLTENCGVVTMCEPSDPVAVIANTAGRPIPGVEVKIVDDAGTTVEAGEAGELLVRGDGVMQGFFQDPAATARAVDAAGWLHTGDIAVADAAGNIKITDRSDDVFIVGGFNAYPAEIEGLLAAHPAVRQSAVVGMPDDRLGSVAHAYVVTRPEAAVDEASLIAWCRANMANYKVPRRISFVDELPQNAAGKVQKFLLRADNR